MTIRLAESNDLQGVRAILNDAILHSTDQYDYKEKTQEQIEDWARTKKEKDFPLLVAVNDKNEVIGFATYGSFRDKEGYRFTVEHSVYVLKGNEGKGIGKQLMNQLVSLAKENGLKQMIAGIDATNTNSIALHEKLGFEKVGVMRKVGFKFNKWLDLCFMQKEL